jgi:hypothetical protein
MVARPGRGGNARLERPGFAGSDASGPTPTGGPADDHAPPTRHPLDVLRAYIATGSDALRR